MMKYHRYMILMILIKKKWHVNSLLLNVCFVRFFFFGGGGLSLAGCINWSDQARPKEKIQRTSQCYWSVCYINTNYYSVFLVALKPFEGREDLHLTVMEGLNINLPCEPPASNPPATILFLVNGSSVISGKSGELN